MRNDMKVTQKKSISTNLNKVDGLFEPWTLNKTLNLKNRIVMAPMTRCLADDNLVPTTDMANYYERRADAGLIITEATVIRTDGQGYPNTPGIYSLAQIEGWKQVTKKVHANGGKIFLQLFHAGRVSHPVYLKGELPIAPSSIALEGIVSRTDGLHYPEPRALTIDEIQPLVDSFAQAAKNAMQAGFDGVEIHAANGYIIDQFLHWQSNRRTDKYGSTPENMTLFALQVVDSVINAIGADRVGIRLSPAAYLHIDHHQDDIQVFRYLLPQLEQRGLAYLHTGMFDDSLRFDDLGGNVTSFLRKHYKGSIIASGSYSAKDAVKSISKDLFNLIAFGRSFIANPDLIHKIKSGEELVKYDESMLTTLI